MQSGDIRLMVHDTIVFSQYAVVQASSGSISPLLSDDGMYHGTFPTRAFFTCASIHGHVCWIPSSVETRARQPVEPFRLSWRSAQTSGDRVDVKLSDPAPVAIKGGNGPHTQPLGFGQDQRIARQKVIARNIVAQALIRRVGYCRTDLIL